MRISIPLVVILSLLYFPVVVSAQSIGCDIHGIYAFDFDGDTGAFGEADYDDVAGGASFFFAFIPALRLEFGADWIKTKNKDLDNSQLTLSPLTVGLRAGITLDRFYFYLGGGLGYAIYRLQLTGDAERDLATRGIYDPDIANDVTYFAMLGAEMAVSEYIGIRTEYRYNWLRTKFKYDDYLGNEEEEDINLDHQELRAGLVVYF
ncbi:MAG: outer membrane beta-barrel protein [Candidatus Auribacterota bacterium]|nr:outer membrane beta-barrel protein [Candidatus Auribacterota bacterium]